MPARRHRYSVIAYYIPFERRQAVFKLQSMDLTVASVTIRMHNVIVQQRKVPVCGVVQQPLQVDLRFSHVWGEGVRDLRKDCICSLLPIVIGRVAIIRSKGNYVMSSSPLRPLQRKRPFGTAH